MAQMAAMANQMAALQAEILQLRGIHKAKDEDDLEYTPPADAVRKLFADAAAVPESFSMTPQRGQAAAEQAGERADRHGAPAGPETSWTQRGWVDYGVGVAPPPQRPPGVADPLANPLLDPWKRSAQTGEKHAEEAMWASRGWIDRSKAIQAREAWCTPTQWRGDWQQCMPAQFSNEPRGVWGMPLPDLDKKDIEKPEKYSGDISGWLRWRDSFVRFLRRKDWRWKGLLERVQELRGKPVTPEHERQWEWEMGLGGISKFKEQLNELLMQFTKDTAKHTVDACGDHNALDAWRILAERGHSLRPQHVVTMMEKAVMTRAPVAAKDLEQAIANSAPGRRPQKNRWLWLIAS